MKTVLLGALLLLVQNGLVAQNLVPNPSFEVFSDCPQFYDGIYLADGWSSYGLTPDYFNSCANSIQPYLGTPVNSMGHQWPHSGNAYAGVVTFLWSASEVREAMGTQLLQPLTVGTKYYVTFFISKSGNPSFSGATNNFGIKLLMSAHSETNAVAIDNTSILRDSIVVTDTTNWTKISGSFIADSAYTHMSLGNFYDDAHTDTVFEYPNYAYYFVDDVCLTNDSLFNASWTGVSHQPVSTISVYPNPASGVLYVQSAGKTGYSIVDALGRKAMEGFFENSAQLDVTPLPSGVYIVSVTGNKIVQRKQIIMR